MPKLELYMSYSCPFSLKVINFIKKNNIKDKVEIKETDMDKRNKETLEEVGGKYQIPCLFIDGKPLYESDDIIEYLQKNIVD